MTDDDRSSGELKCSEISKKCYFVSVGTSIVDKYNEDHGAEYRDKLPRKYIDLLNCDFQKVTSHTDGMKSAPYSEFFNEITTWLKHVSVETLAKKSAELSSLLLWKHAPGLFSGFSDLDQIILVTTSTPEGYLCANALKEILRRHWSEITDEHSGTGAVPEYFVEVDDKTEGLGRADDPEFAAKGLPGFLNHLYARIASARARGFEVILVPTGGYKALIPYMVILGILQGVTVRYVYEKSECVLELPRIPLGLDVERWTRERFHLQSLLGQEYDTANVRYGRLDPDFRSLVENAQGKFALSILGNFFETAYRSFLWRTPLKLSSSKTHLLDYLDKGLKDKFLRLTDIGELIWKGDRVPEMVDHSVKHHYDLFVLAERFLLPILYNNASLLSSEELFVLLCALYLHDCGHSLGTVIGCDGNRVSLFPTEIREYHHILGYERLRNHSCPAYISKDLYQALGWHTNSGETWNSCMEIIATVGLFHRQRMPLSAGAAPNAECTLFRREYPPLMKPGAWPLNFYGKAVDASRVALLVCLLRIIDGLDSQRARSGGMLEETFQLAQTETESEEECNRANMLGGFVQQQLEESQFSELENAIGACITGYRTRESKHIISASNSHMTRLSAGQFREFLESLTSNDRCSQATRGLVFQYVLARLRADFKAYQKEHYTSHAFVRDIAIEATRGDRLAGGTKRYSTEFVIDIDVETDVKTLERLQISNEKATEMKQRLLEKLRGEYEVEEILSNGSKVKPVIGILEENGIIVKYNTAGAP